MRFIFVFICTLALHAVSSQLPHDSIVVHMLPGKPVRQFIPSQFLGAAFDGHAAGEIKKILQPVNIAAMRSMGFHRLSYRLRTELGNEAWHWNPHGRWSDPKKNEGYWVSDNFSAKPIEITNGYRLPRRGNSHDQANDDGYSMLDDGDEKTFWKSNPYLDAHYTGDADSLHTQWVVIDLGREMPVNAVQVSWANPFAKKIIIDYAGDIGNNFFDPYQPHLWRSLPYAAFMNSKAGNRVYTLSAQPVSLRLLRIQLYESSYTSDGKGHDIRNQLGYAIKEIRCGLWHNGEMQDYIQHAPNNVRQSNMFVSSTDPWHRAVDLHPDVEQAGVDLFFRSGITGKDDVMFPLGIFYDTPENMKALVQYISARKYRVTEFELGEEPDGQRAAPADFAALYCLFSKQVKQILPGCKMGGPSFATLATWEDDEDNYTERKWMHVFLRYLQDHHCSGNFNFFSFEWYPFDNICAPTAPQLLAQPQMLIDALNGYKDEVLPQGIPVYITEYGYSAHSGKAQVETEGALMYADIMALSLLQGVDKTYLYGYEPSQPASNEEHCAWGNNMLFGMDDEGKIIYKVAAYYGVNMVIKNWIRGSDSLIEVYPADVLPEWPSDTIRISAYALREPGGRWSFLLINKDEINAHRVTIKITDDIKNEFRSLHYPLQFLQYSSRQYRWLDDKDKGHPLFSLPPETKQLLKNDLIELPPYSLTVISE